MYSEYFLIIFFGFLKPIILLILFKANPLNTIVPLEPTNDNEAWISTGLAAVVASIVPKDPFLNFKVATAVSYASNLLILLHI